MRIMEIGKETGIFAAGLRDTALPDGTGVCLIGLALEDSDPFEIWVGEYTRELIMALKQEYEAVCEKRRKYLIVMLAEDMKVPFAQAAADGCWEALRGIVHVLTMEKRADRLVLNLIRGRKKDKERITDAVAFLAEEHADFCAGCTFDVREWK